MLLILHPQHRPWSGDFGAASDLDGDGVIEPGERERNLVVRYVAAAAEESRRLGLDARILDPAVDSHLPRTYAEIHAVVGRLVADLGGGPALYVAAHINAGRGDGALVEYDSRSTRGAAAAQALCQPLRAFPELADARPTANRDDRHHQDATGAWMTAVGQRAWFYRGWGCIAGIYQCAGVCGVVYEPFFLDQPDHLSLTTPDGLRRVGVALATGAAVALGVGR